MKDFEHFYNVFVATHLSSNVTDNFYFYQKI